MIIILQVPIFNYIKKKTNINKILIITVHVQCVPCSHGSIQHCSLHRPCSCFRELIATSDGMSRHMCMDIRARCKLIMHINIVIAGHPSHYCFQFFVQNLSYLTNCGSRCIYCCVIRVHRYLCFFKSQWKIICTN